MATQINCWAPLVFGRTLNVDFRLLSIPKDISPTDLGWMRAHIDGSTIYPDDLREGHRWSLFKNQRYCVIGLTCMASLVSARRTVVQNRELYLFAGYASLIDRKLFPQPPHHPPIPTLRKIDQPGFRVFRTLYDFVDFLWADERTSLSPDEIASDIERPFRPVPQLERILAAPTAVAQSPSKSRLNRDSKQLRIFPDDVAKTEISGGAESLWAEAATCDRPVTLCIGLPERSAAINGPFMNVTSYSATETETVTRGSQEAKAGSPEDSASVTDSTIRKQQSVRSGRRKTNYLEKTAKFLDIMEHLVEESGDSEDGDWIDYDSVEYEALTTDGNDWIKFDSMEIPDDSKPEEDKPKQDPPPQTP